MVMNRQGSYDFADKLNYVWSCIILLSFVIVVELLRFCRLESLISCWTPTHFLPAYNAYSLEQCWGNPTGYITDDAEGISDEKPYEIFMNHTIIPTIILFMIVGFKVPEAVKRILDLCVRSSSVGRRGRSVTVSESHQQHVEELEALTDIGKEISQSRRVARTVSFFFVKFLICINLMFQFIYIRTNFTESRDSLSDTEIVGNTTHEEAPVIVFPKSIFCDFYIRMMQNVQHYTVQCDLPINSLYQQFFLVFKFWLLVVMVCSWIVFLGHLLSLLVPAFVKVRFRGVIPEKELHESVAPDVLLYLEDVKKAYGVGVAREVSSRIWNIPKEDFDRAV